MKSFRLGLTAILLCVAATTSRADQIGPGAVNSWTTIARPDVGKASVVLSGMLADKAIAALPKHTTEDYSGYPGSKWHWGAIVNDAQWREFNKLAKLPPLADMDWKTEIVAFVVFDAHTNALGFASWSVDKKGGTLAYRHSGIEPAYRDVTPAVLVRVARINTLNFVTQGDSKNVTKAATVLVSKP